MSQPALPTSKRRAISRPFILINMLLLLLYGWTLSEESSLSIQVEDGTCTAIFPGQTSGIPCLGAPITHVGLYFQAPDEPNLADFGPLDWLAPGSAWHTIRQTSLSDPGLQFNFYPLGDIPGWQQIAGEWRAEWDAAAMLWKAPLPDHFLLEAALRRPDERAGILLLEEDQEQGWAFIISPRGRRGVWWRWQDGRPASPIVGIPYQKSLLAQSQSLLRRLLRAHQGALLLLAAGWLLRQIIRRLRRPVPALAVPDRLIIGLAALLAFAAAAYAASQLLERIPHVQDSITYLFQGQTLARGKLWAPAPAMPQFFKEEFLLVRDGKWFGKYPPGYPLILALGLLLETPWLVNPILAALTIPLLYALGRALYRPAIGRSAALLAVVSPFFLFMSGSLMPHAAELFWITLFMLAWVKGRQPGAPRRWIFIAAAALGMAFLTRQITAVVIGAAFVGAASLADLIRQRRAAWPGIIQRAGLLLAGLLPFLLLLLGYQSALTGDPWQDPRLLFWPFDRPGFGDDIGMGYNAFTLDNIDGELLVSWFRDPDQPPAGHTPARGIYNLEQNWRSLEQNLFGWPFIFTLAFAWLPFLLRRPSEADWILLVTSGALCLAYITFWASGIMYGPRYLYPILPGLLLLTARGIYLSGCWLGGRAGTAAIASLAALLVAGSLLFYFPQAIELYRGYNFVSRQGQDQVEAAVSGSALIFIPTNGIDWWDYGRFFSGNTPWLDTPIIYAIDRGIQQDRQLAARYPDHTPYRYQAGQLLPLTTTAP